MLSTLKGSPRANSAPTRTVPSPCQHCNAILTAALFVCVRSAQVYTGNWPMGSLLGSMSEGERLLRVPELKDKDICFLANHGTLSTEMALSHLQWPNICPRSTAMRHSL